MTWSEALDAYLKRKGVKGHEAAAALGVAPSTVHYWRHGSEPRGDEGRQMKARVEEWTGGEVPAAPWSTPDETGPVLAVDTSKAG